MRRFLVVNMNFAQTRRAQKMCAGILGSLGVAVMAKQVSCVNTEPTDEKKNSIMLPQLLDSWTAVPVTRSLVQLGVPDAVPPKGVIELDRVAKHVDAEPEMLRRAIQFVAGFGVFEEHGDGKVSHTPVSLQLCSGGSLHNKVLYRGSREIVMPYVDGFQQVLKDPSKSAFTHLSGEDYFTEWLPKNPHSEALFGKYMSEASSMQIPLILAAYPWPNKGTIADIAGGNGHLLRSFVTTSEGVSGIVFDLPSTIATAKSHWEVGDVMHTDRVKFVAGDFFESVDVVADMYVLKWVLHDWPDDRCIKILSNIRAAAPKGSCVVIIDMLVPENELNSYHISKFFDMHMAAGYGGKERTSSDMRAIAESAGWAVQGIWPVGKSPFACIVLQVSSASPSEL
mmetsp:Transcript_4785/g.8680  ORF Transcript_4785/g.8680 Transcript_4785/m.8680 type:complete len:395 (+) Transcript_4785:32-1216(+)